MVQYNPAELLQVGPLNVPVSLQPAARPMLVLPVGAIVRLVVRLVVQAKRAGLPVSLLEIKAAVDPELESWREVVVRVSLMCTPEVGLQAWEELSERLETLRSGLDTFQKELMDESVAFQVVWPEVR